VGVAALRFATTTESVVVSVMEMVVELAGHHPQLLLMDSVLLNRQRVWRYLVV
jgi:hypothetical protein